MNPCLCWHKKVQSLPCLAMLVLVQPSKHLLICSYIKMLVTCWTSEWWLHTCMNAGLMVGAWLFQLFAWSCCMSLFHGMDIGSQWYGINGYGINSFSNDMVSTLSPFSYHGGPFLRNYMYIAKLVMKSSKCSNISILLTHIHTLALFLCWLFTLSVCVCVCVCVCWKMVYILWLGVKNFL